MIATEYEKLLSALRTVSRVLDANQGQLNAADIRIRCLINIAAKEAKRAVLEVGQTGQSRGSEHLNPEGAPLAEIGEPSR